VSDDSEVTKARLEPGVDKLGVPFWSCPGCGKQWIKTQRNYCPKCRFGMERRKESGA
jgi:rubrerythrin